MLAHKLNHLDKLGFLLIVSIIVAGCYQTVETADADNKAPDNPSLSVATFAGGCFWCVESDFEKLHGVEEVISGFSGGKEVNPTYKQVASGQTAHIETVQVYYNPNKIQYEDLLHSFWRQINPTDSNGQFVDRGPHYRPAIFFHNAQQKALAEQSMQQLDASGRFDKPITTEIIPFDTFYVAEDYHQDYYKNNPVRYNFYRYNSGRDQFLEATWGDDLHTPRVTEPEDGTNEQTYVKPSDSEIKERLTDIQYQVTQKDGTERPYKNKYWDNKEEGIYVDIVSGEPLFSSSHKYDSKTGWPSFYQPLVSNHIVEKTDFKLIYPRTEVRSKFGDSHLGHVFKDGPAPTGLRYCINSASLRFVAKSDLEKEGYGEYASLFDS